MSFVWFCFLLCIERFSHVCIHTCLKRRFVHSILGTKFCIWMYVFDWACLSDYLNFCILFLLSGKPVGLRERVLLISPINIVNMSFFFIWVFIYVKVVREGLWLIYILDGLHHLNSIKYVFPFNALLELCLILILLHFLSVFDTPFTNLHASFSFTSNFETTYSYLYYFFSSIFSVVSGMLFRFLSFFF